MRSVGRFVRRARERDRQAYDSESPLEFSQAESFSDKILASAVRLDCTCGPFQLESTTYRRRIAGLARTSERSSSSSLLSHAGRSADPAGILITEAGRSSSFGSPLAPRCLNEACLPTSGCPLPTKLLTRSLAASLGPDLVCACSPAAAPRPTLPLRCYSLPQRADGPKTAARCRAPPSLLSTPSASPPNPNPRSLSPYIAARRTSIELHLIMHQ